MRVLAPAKVNLFLRIVGRREDGYHRLDSLMLPVSLCDEIHIGLDDVVSAACPAQICLSCDDPCIPSDETNLACRAAVLLCQEAGLAACLSLRLIKRIPAGAGLGGGSSDAAAVLKGLNSLLRLGWTEQRLCELGLRLGADVPFFIPCQPARVAGIGEELRPVRLVGRRWLVLVIPAFGVSTAWAYRRFDQLIGATAEVPRLLRSREGRVVSTDRRQDDLPFDDSSPTIAVLADGWPSPAACVNDLERAVLPAHPLLRDLKNRLLGTRAEAVLMSGSGSAVFGLFGHRAAAHRAADSLAKTVAGQGRVFVVESLAEEPRWGPQDGRSM